VIKVSMPTVSGQVFRAMVVASIILLGTGCQALKPPGVEDARVPPPVDRSMSLVPPGDNSPSQGILYYFGWFARWFGPSL
jgi:hypothetical protein